MFSAAQVRLAGKKAKIKFLHSIIDELHASVQPLGETLHNQHPAVTFFYHAPGKLTIGGNTETSWTSLPFSELTLTLPKFSGQKRASHLLLRSFLVYPVKNVGVFNRFAYTFCYVFSATWVSLSTFRIWRMHFSPLDVLILCYNTNICRLNGDPCSIAGLSFRSKIPEHSSQGDCDDQSD